MAWGISGLPLSRADFAYVCMCIDELLGRRVMPASAYDFESIRRDRLRRSYVQFVTQLATDTRLGAEIVLLFKYMMLSVHGRNVSPSGEQLGRSATTRRRVRLPFADLEALRLFVIGYANRCPFEPAWHRGYRGDTRAMRNTYPNNEWSYLVRAYMNSDCFDDDEGEYVKKARRRTKGYARCLDSAKSDSLASLRGRYGDDYGRDGRGRDEALRSDHVAVMTMDEILTGHLPF